MALKSTSSTGASTPASTIALDGFETEEDSTSSEYILSQPQSHSQPQHQKPPPITTRRLRSGSPSSSFSTSTNPFPQYPRRATRRITQASTPTRNSPRLTHRLGPARQRTSSSVTTGNGMTSRPYTPTSEFDTSSIAPPPPSPKVISSEKRARKVRRRKPAQDLQDRIPEGLPRDYYEPLEEYEPEYDISDYAMPAPPSSSKPRPRRHTPSSKSEHPFSSITTHFSDVFAILLFLLKAIFSLLKKPLMFLLTLYLFAAVTSLAGGHITSVVYHSLRSLCLLPGVTTFHLLPFCPSTPSTSSFFEQPTWSDWLSHNALSSPSGASWTSIFRPQRYPAPDFTQLTHLQSHFSSILSNSEIGSIMGLELKNAEISLRDLSTLVKASRLQCRPTLASHLDGFVASSKAVSLDLSRLESKVGGAIDIVLAMNKYSLQSLEAAKQRSMEIMDARLSGGIVGMLLAPFRMAEATVIQNAVRDTFLSASTVLERNLRTLILEAELVYRKLDSLDKKLNTISEIVATEDGRVSAMTEEVLAELWTLLGGNRRKLGSLRGHSELLRNVAVFKSRALAQVSKTLLELQTMYTDLESLRDTVAAPLIEEAARDEEDGGDEGRDRDKKQTGSGATAGEDTHEKNKTPRRGIVPLEVQIEAVKLGAQRLEQGLRRAREKLDEDVRRVVDRVLSEERSSGQSDGRSKGGRFAERIEDRAESEQEREWERKREDMKGKWEKVRRNWDGDGGAEEFEPRW